MWICVHMVLYNRPSLSFAMWICHLLLLIWVFGVNLPVCRCSSLSSMQVGMMKTFFLVLEKLVPAELIYTYQLYYINISLDLIPTHRSMLFRHFYANIFSFREDRLYMTSKTMCVFLARTKTKFVEWERILFYLLYRVKIQSMIYKEDMNISTVRVWNTNDQIEPIFI